MRSLHYVLYASCLALLFLVALTACSPQPLPQEPTSIPTLVPATLPAEGEMVSQPEMGGGEHPGSGIFQANCAACHNLSAEQKVGPGLAGMFEGELPNGEPLSDENLKAWIRNGGGAMPGIPLSDSDLDTLLDFLKQKLSGEAASESDASEPGGADVAEFGRQVYEANCTVCHNLNDQQKVGPGLAGLFQMDQLPNGKPLDDENFKEWILNGGGAMPGIPLADDELEAMIVYLKDATQ